MVRMKGMIRLVTHPLLNQFHFQLMIYLENISLFLLVQITQIIYLAHNLQIICILGLLFISNYSSQISSRYKCQINIQQINRGLFITSIGAKWPTWPRLCTRIKSNLQNVSKLQFVNGISYQIEMYQKLFLWCFYYFSMVSTDHPYFSCNDIATHVISSLGSIFECSLDFIIINVSIL